MDLSVLITTLFVNNQLSDLLHTLSNVEFFSNFLYWSYMLFLSASPDQLSPTHEGACVAWSSWSRWLRPWTDWQAAIAFELAAWVHKLQPINRCAAHTQTHTHAHTHGLQLEDCGRRDTIAVVKYRV